MLVTSDIKTMSSPTKETMKPTQKLSFSISRILGNTDDKKEQTTRTERVYTEAPRVPYFGIDKAYTEAPRVPYLGAANAYTEAPRVPYIGSERVGEAPRVPYIGTIHHYAYEQETTGETSQLDISGQPRACSTPENEEYPSPTPTYNLLPHGFHVPHPHPLSYHTSPAFYNHSVVRLSSPEASPTDIALKPSVKCFDSCSDKSLDSLGESYQTSPSPLKMKKKKTRTVFSRSQIYQLESAFDLKRYLSSAERGGLATRLSLSETQIKIWFQNRRNKWKRQINGEMDEIPIPAGFAAGFLSQQPYCPPSLNSASHVSPTSEELYRHRLAAPYNYAHPYSLENRRPMSFPY